MRYQFVKAQTALKNKKKYGKKDFQYNGWNYYTLQRDKIMTLISPGDCTLQCDTWLWDDMARNSPKRPPH